MLTHNIYGARIARWWPNSNLVAQTDESFGIVPVLPRHQQEHIQPNDKRIQNYKPSVKFLAVRMKCVVPHLPVTTKEECILYSKRISFYLPINITTALPPAIFNDMAKDWNSGTMKDRYKGKDESPPPDGINIFQKLPEHLMNFYRIYYRYLFL